MDERFKQGIVRISNWLESCKREYNSVTNLTTDLTQFFAQHITYSMAVDFSNEADVKQRKRKGKADASNFTQARLGNY